MTKITLITLTFAIIWIMLLSFTYLEIQIIKLDKLEPMNGFTPS